MPKRRLSLLAAVGLVALLAACWRGQAAAPASSPVRAFTPPRNGLEVIGAMRRAHPSRALRSLAFSVSTTEHHTDSSRVARSRAFAVLPGRFRETRLPSSTRSGYVRNRQQLALFEGGRRVSTLSGVDLATLLTYDIFAQSIDTTIMWLDSVPVRFGFARVDELEGRPVWVVGATQGDTTSTQFWVDAERWRVLRVIQPDPREPSAIVDVRFTEFTEVLDVPVPTRIVTYRNGELVQTQDISDLVANPSLPSRIFDLSRWRER